MDVATEFDFRQKAEIYFNLRENWKRKSKHHVVY